MFPGFLVFQIGSHTFAQAAMIVILLTSIFQVAGSHYTQQSIIF
jgi:hypothetical protein